MVGATELCTANRNGSMLGSSLHYAAERYQEKNYVRQELYPSLTYNRGMAAEVRTVGNATAPEDISTVLREDGCVTVSDVVSPQVMDQITTELKPYVAAT